MSYNSSIDLWTVSRINKSVMEHESTFENVIQRGLVWNAQQKSDLIWSLAMHLPLPDVLAKKVLKKVDGKDVMTYDVFDGKQRMNTISQFLNDAFKCKKVKPVEYTDANKKKKVFDMSGKKFSEFPLVLQDIIKEHTMTMTFFDDITQDEMTTLYILRNNGKPLTPKNKALAWCNDRDNMLRIGQHNIFNSQILTKKGRENKDEVTIITKCWMILNQDIDSVNFGGKNLNATIENLTINKTDEKKIVAIFDYADKVLEILNNKETKLGRRFVKEVHFVSLVPYIQKAIDKKIKHDDFASFIESNFDTETKKAFSEAYTEASSNAINNPRMIKIRYDEIGKAFKKAFK